MGPTDEPCDRVGGNGVGDSLVREGPVFWAVSDNSWNGSAMSVISDTVSQNNPLSASA